MPSVPREVLKESYLLKSTFRCSCLCSLSPTSGKDSDMLVPMQQVLLGNYMREVDW